MLLGVLSLAAAPQALSADPVVAAVGDLGCGPNDPSYNNGAGTATDCRQRYISDLAVAANPDALLLLGDTQYETGQLSNFNAVFNPTYGRLNAVVYPVPGNIEYDDGFTAAEGYYNYFTTAGVQSRIAASGNGTNVNKGYYSFDVGNWHIIGLNSNCTFANVGGCGPGSPQETWLKADLAANAGGKCVLAYAHHARWNSGSLGDDDRIATFWTDLYNARADVVLAGHSNHHYERHALQNASGNPDANGIREFIVSTGGEHHGTPPGSPGNADTLQVANYSRYGILKLTLHPTSYDWEFVQDAGTTPPPAGPNFTDSGTENCHTAAATAPAAPSISATAGNGSASLSWTAPANGGAAISAYKVYRGTSPGTGTLLQTLGNVTTYTDSTATNGNTYYYRVSAVNSIGEGAKSNEVSATPSSAPPVFPRTGVLDTFARPAGGLGANWQSPALQDGGTVTIASSGLTRGSAGGSATWNLAYGADQEVHLTVPTLPAAGNYVQVYGRVSTQSAATVSMYFLRVTPSSSTWNLRKKINGENSTSITTFSAPLVAGDSIGLALKGPTLTAYRKAGSGAWSSVGSATDAAIPAGGYISFNLSDTTARGGAFGGGTIPSGPSAPAAPALTATPANGSVGLSWTAPSDGGAAISAYKVYRGTSPGSGTLLQTVGNVTTYTDSTATNGNTYYYRVSAVNSIGEGAQSAEVAATPRTVPAAPALTAAAGNNSVALSWNAPANGGAAISAYKVYRGTSPDSGTLLQTTANVTTYTDSTATNGTTYYYRVSAVNPAGEGAQSNEVSATPSIVVTAPAAPTLTATPGNALVSLSWTAPANGGAAISAYKVYRGTSPGTGTLLQTLGNVTTYTDSTATNGNTYYYRVSAVNSIGEGAKSNEVSATPTAPPPPPPPAAFPKTGVLDTFARPAGGLGANWQSPAVATAGTVTIASSGLTRSSAGSSSARWNLAYGADQEVHLTVPTLPAAGNYVQVYGRATSVANISFYFLRVTPSSSTWNLRKKINGADSVSITTFSAPFVAGDSLGLQLKGATLTAYRKAGSGAWSSVGSATDAALPAGGFIAFNLGDTTARGGAFGGGTIPAA